MPADIEHSADADQHLQQDFEAMSPGLDGLVEPGAGLVPELICHGLILAFPGVVVNKTKTTGTALVVLAE
jgi:hypothetical protein